MHCETLYTSKGNVLCNLDTKTLETNDEDVGGAHASHGFVAQDIELATVERLVDFIVSDYRIVDLHAGSKVDFLRVLWQDGQLAM